MESLGGWGERVWTTGWPECPVGRNAPPPATELEVVTRPGDRVASVGTHSPEDEGVEHVVDGTTSAQGGGLSPSRGGQRIIAGDVLLV